MTTFFALLFGLLLGFIVGIIFMVGIMLNSADLRDFYEKLASDSRLMAEIKEDEEL